MTPQEELKSIIQTLKTDVNSCVTDLKTGYKKNISTVFALSKKIISLEEKIHSILFDREIAKILTAPDSHKKVKELVEKVSDAKAEAKVEKIITDMATDLEEVDNLPSEHEPKFINGEPVPPFPAM